MSSRKSTQSSRKSLKEFQEVTQRVPGSHSKSFRKSLKEFQEVTQRVPGKPLKEFTGSHSEFQEVTQRVPGYHLMFQENDENVLENRPMCYRKSLKVFQETQNELL